MTATAASVAAADLPVITAVAADGSLYPIGKLAAHRRPVLHLAVSVFLFDGDRLLVQRRAAGKYHCGGLWANTCCSHPNWGEGLADCATRRMVEELGFAVPLAPTALVEYRAPVGRGLWEYERVQVYRADASRRTVSPAPDPAEVSAVRWATPADLAREMDADPAAFAPWFRIYPARWPELRL